MTDAQHGEKPTPLSDVPSPERVPQALAALLCVAAVTLFASGVFVQSPLLFTLAPVAGIVAALACRTPVDAAGCAAAGVLLGISLTSVFSRIASRPLSVWLPNALVVALVAAVLAFAIVLLRSSGGRIDALLTVLCVVIIIGTSWFVSVKAVSAPGADGVTAASKLLSPVPIEPGYVDETLYQYYLIRMFDGDSYYVAAGTTLSEANRTLSANHRIGLDSPLAYRLPTMYWVMSKLPRSGIALVLATLVIGVIASVSAYALARAFVAPAFALVGLATVASMYCGLSQGAQLLHTEVWAGSFALLSVALFVNAGLGARRNAFLWASAAAALLAAMTRELAVAFLLLGLAASLVEPRGRREREWLPWVAGLVAFGAFYAIHARNVASVYPALAALYPSLAATAAGATPHYFDPSLLGGAAVLDRVGEVMWLAITPIAVIALCGAIGGLWAPRRLAEKLYLGGATAGGLVAVALFHPTGSIVNGLPPGYWGQLVMPTVAAAAPLAATLAPWWRLPKADLPAD